jgi:ribosomal protein S18 acetylase RimI-like enzyme
MPEIDTIQIGPAEPADADAAEGITREAFDGVSIDQAIERLVGPLPGVRWGDVKSHSVRVQFEQTPQRCLVARLQDGRVVGFVTTRDQVPGLRGRIADLAVAADFRGHGLGRRLIDAAVEMLRQAGYRQVQIETLESNPVGRHLYPRMGFREVARQLYYAKDL